MRLRTRPPLLTYLFRTYESWFGQCQIKNQTVRWVA